MPLVAATNDAVPASISQSSFSFSTEIRRSVDHPSMRLTPAAQAFDWDYYPGVDTVVPAQGKRMTPLYAFAGWA